MSSSGLDKLVRSAHLHLALIERWGIERVFWQRLLRLTIVKVEIREPTVPEIDKGGDVNQEGERDLIHGKMSAMKKWK